MKEDRRVRKTKSSIKKAFTKLLQEKDLDKITISDITTRADVNRGTFYLHYEDKYMLLADMEDEYIAELSSYTKFNELQGASVEDIANEFVNNVLKNIFQHIHNNLEFYHTILQLERTSQLELKINEHIRKNMQKYISIDHTVGGVPEMYFYSYVSGATISIIKYWVLDDQPISVDELAKHIHNIVFNGPLRIMAKNRLHKSHVELQSKE
ncbi:TetR/AcrR family transcriptional regulator [Staphylococcus simiae]|uniref:TetR family regulatory protein n=1 Tax=Staphylococcus simiae CCM 7213 = CCUG 51256 TaxID=911238 RepID=G5JKK8_9STAP|nr:TetR/AcrR family transcriptional regulator [Staphylococcus simiae]EHJ07274.1 TetR family regulatory protein [Staphylococcus simiae CCM 7213 = CCUG 51256]PNZ13338.1 TetR/AcrR family transcriptional regulator [Staphylococcus simiae]SNV80673.1 Transcriptional regulator, TetR family [Staphylococcus simiae]